jgi:predicted HTH transcriptional regulator
LEEKEYIRWRPFDASYDNGATLEDLDEDKMKNFIHMARAKRNFPLPVETSPISLLTHLDLIDDKGRLANAAVLLFGKKPQKYFITSEVKCVQFYGNVVEKPMPAYQIYRGDVFELVDQATSFVMSRINNWVGTREEGEKADIPTRPELPIDAVKEAIVNAVCHRDYTSNASVQIMLFRDRLEVWNPGILPYGLTVQKLHGPHKSLPANPLLADPMYWNGYIEKIGTGTEDIINKCREYGLKTPEFYQEEDFRVVIWRTENENCVPECARSVPGVYQGVPGQLVDLIKANPSISRDELSKRLNISVRQVRKIIDQLRNDGVLTRQGGDAGRWTIHDVHNI